MNCNPYLPFSEFIPDGEPHVFNDRLYVYGSHDAPGVNKFCVGDYTVWSCDINDLTNWKYEGVSYTRTSDPHNFDGSRALFAPDVAKGTDGCYYLYYCLDFLQEIGVAKSSCPEGPFTFYGHIHYPDGTLLKEYFPYDPAVLVDDDGSVYLYYGFAAHFEGGSFGTITPSPGCMVIQLESDMVTVKMPPVLCLPTDKNCIGTSFPPEHAYFEAPSIRKINGQYILVYSSQAQHELCYAVSSFPDRNFVYQGVLISNGDIGLDGNRKPVNYIGTNHGGICQIHDAFYVFYHRNTHGLATSRQGCAERIFPDHNGHFPQTGITSYGLYGRPFSEARQYSAFEACYLECLDTSPCMKINQDFRDREPYFSLENKHNDPLCIIANIHNRCMFGYNAFSLDECATFILIIRGTAKGKIIVSSDRDRTNILGQTDIIVSGEQIDFPVHLSNSSGTYKLFFTYYGQGSLDFLSLKLTKSNLLD